MAKVDTVRAKAGQVDFALPVHDKTATAKVNGATVTIASQSEQRITLAVAVAQNDLVEITFTPINQSGQNRSELSTPTTGQTVSPTVLCGLLVIQPAGTLAALTVNFPSTPTDRSEFRVTTSQILTALTWGNGTVVGAPSTLAANTAVSFQFSTQTGKWYKLA